MPKHERAIQELFEQWRDDKLGEKEFTDHVSRALQRGISRAKTGKFSLSDKEVEACNSNPLEQ